MARRRKARRATACEEAVVEVADDLPRILEALLFAAHEPLPLRRIAGALGRVSPRRVQEALEEHARRLDEQGAPLQIVEMAGGYRLVTRPEYAPYLARLFHKGEKERLSPAALETLAIVAYRQPVTRSDVEGIRGVQAGPLLRVLQDRRLVRVVGRAPVIGRPLQYGTTRRFLDHFGLASLRDLPEVLGQGGQLVEGSAPAPADNGAATAPDGDGSADDSGSAPAGSP